MFMAPLSELHLHDERVGQETGDVGGRGVSPVENAVQLKLLMTGSVEQGDAQAAVAVQGAQMVLMWFRSVTGLTYLRDAPCDVQELMTTLHRKVMFAEAPPWSSAIEIAWPSTRATCARAEVNSSAVPCTSHDDEDDDDEDDNHAFLGINHSCVVIVGDSRHDVAWVAGGDVRPVENVGTTARGALMDETGPLATRYLHHAKLTPKRSHRRSSRIQCVHAADERYTYHFCDAVLMTSPCVTMAVTEPDEGQAVITRSTTSVSGICCAQQSMHISRMQL
jgi:hypothetical protein